MYLCINKRNKGIKIHKIMKTRKIDINELKNLLKNGEVKFEYLKKGRYSPHRKGNYEV